MAPPPPPGPPPPPKGGQAAPRSLPKPPIVAKQRPEGAFHLELIIYNGAPYKDHWAYYIQSSTNPNIGVVIHAIGDVRNGFSLECKRSYNIAATRRRVTRISLAWIAGRHIDENAMLGKGLSNNILNVPVHEFERSAFKVLPPGKTLNAAEDRIDPKKKVVQRNCQTWVIESAVQLVRDGIIDQAVATYLGQIKQ